MATTPRDHPPLFFSGFPYLSTWIVPRLCHIILLPKGASAGRLRDLARRQADANRLPTCLVLKSDLCLYLSPDGSESQSEEIPQAEFLVTGKLLPAEDFSGSSELSRRTDQLHGSIEERKHGGYLVCRSKRGRPAATQEEQRLQGVNADGVLKGLARCARCSEWKGSCLDPSPVFRGHVMSVSCRCDNDNRCARCGGLLHDRKLNSNYYDERDGQVWHVPGFCGFGHICNK